MVKCDYCGKDEYMPFRCKYCGGYYCSEHRLPEIHNCSGNYQFSRSTTGQTGFTPTGYSYSPQSQPRTLGIFGKNELRDLGIGLGVIMLILLSGYWRAPGPQIHGTESRLLGRVQDQSTRNHANASFTNISLQDHRSRGSNDRQHRELGSLW